MAATSGACSLSWRVKNRPACSGIRIARKIILFDDVAERPVHVHVVLRSWLAIHPEQLFVIVLQRDCAPGLRNGFHSGHGGDLVVEFAEGGANGRGSRVDFRGRQ